MNVKTFSCALMVGCFGLCTPFPAFEASAATQEEIKDPTGLIIKQIENSHKYIESLKKEGKPVRLVMGVDNGEDDLLKRFDATYIFLNESQKNPFDTRSLSVSFNDLSHLEFLASGFVDIFDEIILDDSTFKFTHWTTQHLDVFKGMLKPGGKFIFGPFTVNSLSFDRMNSQDLLKKKIIEETNLDSRNSLIWSYKISYPFPIKEGAYQEKIEDLFKKYKQLQPLKEEEKWRKLSEFGLNSLYPDQVLNVDEELRTAIVRDVNKNEFLKDFFDTVIVPRNYVRILETVFGKGNVVVEHDKPLPFESHYRKTQKTLITVTKQKKKDS